ncbi:hypothetical protein [Jiulongibacter sp. NS-SX5]|uniref:hypothetical protein n=1 Tax=Jiulongibacter sp. NS-SX5 TaxID=3463854 RepID=UPI00405880CB
MKLIPLLHLFISSLLSGQMDKTMDEEGTILDDGYKAKVDLYLDAYLDFAGKLIA